VGPVNRYRDACAYLWEQMPDGTWRMTYPDGAYMQEANLDQVELWYGPLTEVAES
jgi:hypothetical protein